MTLADHTPETLCCTAIELRYASDKLNNKYVKPPIKVVEENLPAELQVFMSIDV